MANKQISVILNLKDKMSQPLVKVSGNVEKVTREMKKSQNQIERWKNNSIKAMDNFIGKSAKVAGAATALAGAFAVKMGFDGLVELDAGAAKVKSIAKDTLDYADIQKDLLKYSTKTGVGVEELAETPKKKKEIGQSSKLVFSLLDVFIIVHLKKDRQHLF